jgi:hypothetical protein
MTASRDVFANRTGIGYRRNDRPVPASKSWPCAMNLARRDVFDLRIEPMAGFWTTATTAFEVPLGLRWVGYGRAFNGVQRRLND